ncbi:MAG: thiamine pyrophosphate-dependent dehydrogenase E1 component subunit alpha [SAR202 cluster bacterium]|nr:thiamine pyrophosphate-dependent dehydrogenase E1 component subunit alpha [Chloroflexota bacterium]MQG19676.1 thiamine pyrophosphate-dependent dehydrogenase E1 component subunit alpha [SAR202 cluster bacterium]MQG43075.1 thiamine pyrophosphate-dependent dehydrogenase E1 component subunit alpha [SAR202 cluster bacterium]|tara:strand:+ start:3014 stop:4003 length:990 start_codon:yes stop_codon:yes gene_type:complete
MEITNDVQKLMLERMWTIRNFEEKVMEVHEAGEFVGAAHPYIGEEAVAVGVCLALKDTDYIAGNHRSHGHPLAKGGSVKKAMAELYGRVDGYCKGKGGSMHLADFSVGILGESGIVASSVPVATGAGLASKISKNNFVSVVFFGDGASNQGACHESMNLASIWKLPVIFVCENNQFAITTSYQNSVAVENVSDRAQAYNMPGILVDGQNVEAMYEATTEAVKRARNGEGPTLIEGLTYRFEEHSLGLGRVRRGEYRTSEEISKWRERDPIGIHSQKLIDRGVLSEDEINKIESDSKKEIEEAVEFARNSKFPEPEELFEDMWANPIQNP